VRRALVALALLAACGGSSDPAAPERASGLVASVGTSRLFQPRHELGLGLQNLGDEDLPVVDVQLESSLFATVPPTPRQMTFPAGSRRFTVPVAYGDPRCDGDDASITAVVRLDDGRSLRVAASDDGSVVALHQRECAAAEVLEQADIRFGDDWERNGDSIAGELLVDQRGEQDVTVADAAGNVIFTLVADVAGLRVSDDEPSARVPVTISADRCDPHAVAEFKRPMVFLLRAAVGDDEPVPVELEATGASREVLEELLATCGR
jgi:hypothetical protein